MRIFSNFDTNHKRTVVASHIEEYGSNNVLVINRSKLFAWIYVYIPSTIYTLIACLIAYAIVLWIGIELVRWLSLLILLVVWFMAMMPVVKKYIDFKLDFGIITPKGVFSYNQSGILNRNTTSLNIQNIRSIVVNRSWLLYSIFNNGEIIVLSEWSDNSKGEASFNYVHNPEVKRQKIKQIFAKTHITNY
jgi:uncharacterized membrane protein YdbT with pleckstrin-like domain